MDNLDKIMAECCSGIEQNREDKQPKMDQPENSVNASIQVSSALPIQQASAPSPSGPRLNLDGPLEDVTAEKPRPLFNPFSGKHPIRKHEKLEDRLVILMKASGYNNKEIAEQLGISPVTVSYITKQPWATEQILTEIEHSGRDKVIAVLQGAAFDAAERLIQHMEAEDAKISLRASESVLNRVLGMPSQPIEHHSFQHLEELSDAELAKIVSKGRAN